jgi:hypothetical protein
MLVAVPKGRRPLSRAAVGGKVGDAALMLNWLETLYFKSFSLVLILPLIELHRLCSCHTSNYNTGTSSSKNAIFT